MAIKVTDLRKTRTDTWKREGKPVVNHYFECKVEVDGVERDCTLHAMSADGSVKGSKGKFYLTAKINEHEAHQFYEEQRSQGKWSIYLPCQKCRTTTAKEAAKALFPLVEELGGIKLVKWCHTNDGGWYIFDVKSKPVSKVKQTGNYWRCGSDCVGIEMTQIHDCPFHGRVQYVEVEPLD
jgi:hypothetical protein